uniref:Uncharacterized protein n=1 Tax=Sphaerodactylus townsendi TaxID=933632 RepID=A0ACB8FS77_9SAUR
MEKALVQLSLFLVMFLGRGSLCLTRRNSVWALNLPPANLNPNGLRCPVCLALESNHCEGNETLTCTGADNHCVFVSGTVNIAGQPSLFAARGCGTATTCSLPLRVGLYSASIVFTLDKVLCSPEHPAPNTSSHGKKLSQE